MFNTSKKGMESPINETNATSNGDTKQLKKATYPFFIKLFQNVIKKTNQAGGGVPGAVARI